MMEAVLTCSALTKAYGPNKALDNFTAVFSGGRITGLLGPNGSGKTTLMKLAAGLLVPTGGSLRVCGQAPGPQTKARVAYLPERTYLLDMDPAQSHARLQHAEDRMEAAGNDFQRRTRVAFLDLAEREPERFHVIDASQ